MPGRERDKFYHAEQDDPAWDKPDEFPWDAEGGLEDEPAGQPLWADDRGVVPVADGKTPPPTEVSYRRIGPDGIEQFASAQLEGEDRQRPLVVISVERGTSTYLLLPTAVARELGERADVVALRDGNTGWELSKLLGGRLSCYWGAVRIYWPGFDRQTSKAHEHPLWLARSIKTRGPEYVLHDIADAIEGRTPSTTEARPAPPSTHPEPPAPPEAERAPAPEPEALPEWAEARIVGLAKALAEERHQHHITKREQGEAVDRAAALARERAASQELAEGRQAAIEALEARLAQAEDERDEIRDCAAQAEQEREEATQARNALSARVKELERAPRTVQPPPTAHPAPFSIQAAAGLGQGEASDLFEQGLSSELVGAQRELAEARKDEQAAKRQADEQQKRYEGRIRMAEEKLGRAEQKLAEANVEIAALQAKPDPPSAGSVSERELTAANRELQEWQDHAQNLEDQLTELEGARERLAAEVESLKALLPGRASSDLIEQQAKELDIDSVADAIAYAQALPHLRFLKRALGSTGADLFERPQEVYGGFQALEACAVLRVNEGVGDRLDNWFKQQYTVDYAAKESQSTRPKRRFLDDATGKDILCEEHLKFGTGRDPRFCLRVYMRWDDEANEWVIAHVGEHLENTRSA